MSMEKKDGDLPHPPPPATVAVAVAPPHLPGPVENGDTHEAVAAPPLPAPLENGETDKAVAEAEAAPSLPASVENGDTHEAVAEVAAPPLPASVENGDADTAVVAAVATPLPTSVENRDAHKAVEAAAAPPSPVSEENGDTHREVAGERAEEIMPSQGGETTFPKAVALEAGERKIEKPSEGDETAENRVQCAVTAASGAPVVVGLVAAMEGAGVAAGGVKKKRGRPRKYAPDGSLARPLNPVPLSASVPMGGFTPAAAVGTVMKLGRGRSVGFGPGERPRFGFQLDYGGEMVACSAGANFTPHVLTIAAGEDITMKIMSFSQRGPQAICILSANGVVSSVTLRQPDSFGGTLTYEGRFQLLSLSGSFIPSESGGTKSRSGGMSASFAGPDGRVIGGGVAGLLVAAGPVQVVVGSFLPSHQLEQQKNKKIKLEAASISTPVAAIRVSSGIELSFRDGQTDINFTNSKSNLTSTTPFKVENWVAPLQSVPDLRKSVVA